MPEMNHAAEEHKDQPIKVFLIQNFGLLTGVGVILLVVHFGAMIHLEWICFSPFTFTRTSLRYCLHTPLNTKTQTMV